MLNRAGTSRTCAGWIAVMVLAVAACTTQPAAQSGSAAAQPGRPGTPVDVRVTPVVLNATNPSQTRVGRFTFAGGLELVAAASRDFGGLSDLDVLDDGRLLSVTDEGQLLQARLVLDASGRLSGLTDVTLAPLGGADGRPLRDKFQADSEGLALLPGGDWLVSFERVHRIWRYPAGGGPPVPAPSPASATAFPINTGMESLTPLRRAGPGAYLVGSEAGTVWQCDLGSTCRETVLGRRVPDGYGLPAIGVSPNGETLALVARAFDAVRGVRVIVRLVGRAAIDRVEAPLIDELPLLDPLTRDNFEGVAIVAGQGGAALRLYLLSDNNFSTAQHTYLFAFDWSP
jgi:hypothetical protein